MASSSATQEMGSSNQKAPVYEIRGRTMTLEEWELIVQVESPVDFLSLAHHGCDLRDIYHAQGLMDYFGMLSGPTYLTLVRHFWVRAQLYDQKAAQLEMDEKVLIDLSLKGKTREEMGLEPFRGEQIRSSVLGIPVVISVDTIAGVIRRVSGGRYIFGLKGKKSSWIPIVNQTLYNSSTKGRYRDMDMKTKMLLKIESENLLPKGSGGDKPSLDHKVFLHFFLTKERANVPKYIFKHLIKSLEDSQTIKKNFVPYGRLLSEIFHQIGVLDALKSINCYTDAQLSTVTGRIINGATLVTMKLIRKEDHQELRTDLKESSVISNLMDDFPPICKQDPLEVRVMFIKEYYETTGQIIKISDIPDEMNGGALPIARNRKSLKRKMTEAEYLDATPEFDVKVAKISAPESHSPASDMIIPQLEALEADDSEHEDPEDVVEISSGNSSSYISSDSSDLSEGTINFMRQIDEKLQKATKSVSNETDSVNQPPFQHSSSYSAILQDIGKMSERRVEICNQLPANHPFQPPTIEPLQMILPDPVGETVVPASEQVAASEPSASATVPKHTITKTPEKATKSVPQQIELVNQPEPVVETTVPESVHVTDTEQTVIVTVSEPNQQQPEQPLQPSPNQTNISTPTPKQPENQNSPQKVIPEPVVETVVSESVQVTESEQTVAITVSEPIQTTTQPSSTAITNDQPSSSSTIQTLQQPTPPPNMLKSEFLDAELLTITSEVQRLVEQRRSPTLHMTYQE